MVPGPLTLALSPNRGEGSCLLSLVSIERRAAVLLRRAQDERRVKRERILMGGVPGQFGRQVPIQGNLTRPAHARRLPSCLQPPSAEPAPGLQALAGLTNAPDEILEVPLSYFCPRTFRIAARTSDRFMPACRACLRASAMSSSNCSMDGGEIALRMTVSLSPTTTNCEPAFKLSRFRIPSGMTTCPLDDPRCSYSRHLRPPVL